MNHSTKQHSALATVAVVSLAIYVLACTSFSPDDSKVLFPAVDPKSGELGVAVYDRKGGGIEQVFVASRYCPCEVRHPEGVMLRPQWLPDGKSILVVWRDSEANDSKALNIALIPYGRRGTTRLFFIPGVDALAVLASPLAVVGDRLFLQVAANQLVRLDLETGQLRTHTFSGENFTLLGSPNGDRVFYSTEAKEEREIGILDPETFTQTPITRTKTEDTKEGERVVAMSSDAKRIAFLSRDKSKLNVSYTRGASGEKRLSLQMPFEDYALGNGCLAPRQDIIYASYAVDQKEKGSFGLLEIKLDGGPVRCVPLITGLAGADSHMAGYFQMALSHDGKTAAFCSTYLCSDDNEKAKLTKDDVALFLVDLTNADRKVKKIPLPRYVNKKHESPKPP